MLSYSRCSLNSLICTAYKSCKQLMTKNNHPYMLRIFWEYCKDKRTVWGSKVAFCRGKAISCWFLWSKCWIKWIGETGFVLAMTNFILIDPGVCCGWCLYVEKLNDILDRHHLRHLPPALHNKASCCATQEENAWRGVHRTACARYALSYMVQFSSKRK